MNKTIKLIPAFSLLLLLTLLAMTSCNSDGDETISMEYGNPRKMIVGEWGVGNGTRTWVFTDDGYYTDSQDGGKTRHTWRLESTPSDDEPYYGGIYLDGTYYEIISMGDGYWRLKNGNTVLELNRGGSSADDDNSGQGSHDAGGSGKLVSGITVTSGSSRASSDYQTIKFFYDNKNKVTAVEFGGTDEIVIGPQGAHLEFSISGTTMTLTGYYLSNSSRKVTSPGKGQINSNGYLDKQYFESSEYEIKNNDYLIWSYERNSKNEVTKMIVADSKPKGYSSTYTYTWENGCIVSVTGNPGGAGYSRFSFSNIENKTNIDLNLLLYDQMFGEDLFSLALCGYIAPKQKYLVDGNWKLDSSGYPTQITWEGNTYSISYTK